MRRPIPLLLLATLTAIPTAAEASPSSEPAAGPRHPARTRIVLKSHGWNLVGDWLLPPAEPPVPAVLLLHRAAGSRAEHAELAAELARHGIASLALDLRAHGESINRGRFTEPYGEHRHLLEETWRDADAALRWLRARPAVDPDRIAAVGASYSGEAISEALRAPGQPTRAYVLLSPGSFSDESIAAIDPSTAAWLFIRTAEEGEVSRPYVDAVFTELAAASRRAEVRVLPGSGHATEIFESHPPVIGEIADWLARRLLTPDPCEALAEHGPVTSLVRQCAEQRFRQAGARLAELVERLESEIALAPLGPGSEPDPTAELLHDVAQRRFEAFRASQASWHRYRERACEEVYLETYPGSMAASHRAECLRNITEERVGYLAKRLAAH